MGPLGTFLFVLPSLGVHLPPSQPLQHQKCTRLRSRAPSQQQPPQQLSQQQQQQQQGRGLCIGVVGGSGFVGQHLLEALQAIKEGRREEGAGLRVGEVRAYVRSEEAAEKVRRFGAEACAMDEPLDGVDVVIHLAANVALTDEQGWSAFESPAVNLTRHLLEAAEKAGVQRFIYASSTLVFLDARSRWLAKRYRNISEGSPYPRRPLNFYAKSKQMAERMVLGASDSNMTRIVLRPPIVWGPNDTSLLRVWNMTVSSGRHTWAGQGRYLKSTCYVSNVVEGLLKACVNGRSGQAYHVTDGNPVEWREFFTAVMSAIGWDLDALPSSLYKDGKAPNLPRWRSALRLLRRGTQMEVIRHVLEGPFTVDDSVSRKELGYEGRVHVHEGVRRLREWALAGKAT
ncbi:unnamed protein product [Vitrella brassicaformis CCMP3155]|uniref:Ketoreductase domain-containing protein n=2 Tax=Vitrella brassicaformis TaxID=1169539 RepID=A0A0G4EHB8_VITBC|nr:unnamed protein product [Vitrella brassicaformis CCMP3155]|eukprot:CEL95378.1 unnamed protein product [Vitrella brassicaformis CCMP3155]